MNNDLLNELNELKVNLSEVEEYLERVPNLSWSGYPWDGKLSIDNTDNGRYNLYKIKDVIGDEQLKSAIDSFEKNLLADLFKKKKELEDQINKFSISKTDL